MAKNKKEKPVVINASFEQLVKESVADNAVSKKDVTAKKNNSKTTWKRFIETDASN